MTTQAEQIAQAALQAPVNNLVVLVALISLGIVLLVGFTVWKVAPAVINLYKTQAETNAKLTTIVGQNSEQAKLAIQSVDKNTDEMVKQTSAIKEQTSIIQLQGKDLNTYQVLVSDTLSAHTEKIAENTASVQAIKESIDTLSNQIKALLEDKIACADAEDRIKKLYEEILLLVKQQQAKHATGTNPVVVVNNNGESATT